MLRVYVAGAYTADNPIKLFGNMRRGMKLAMKVFQKGMAPFTPWFDYHFFLLGDEKFPKVHDFYAYSIAWLEASDAVLVVPENVEGSKGTKKEIARAEELGIPVFWSMKELLKFKKTKEAE